MKYATLITLLFFTVQLLPQQAAALKVSKEEVILDELNDYELCQNRDRSGELCNDALRRWVKGHPADAFKAGKLTRLRMNHWAALPYFAEAFSHKQGNCKDEDVVLAVIAGLGLPPSQKEPLDQASHIAFDLCFNELKPKLIENASPSSTIFVNICHKLDEKKLLSGLKQKKCQELKK